MERAKSSVQRCAVYTRKSSEEGLEQEFNSLQAQREGREDWVAEREGFEPPEPLGSPDFESGRLNQTPEPLRDRRASMFAPAQSSWSRPRLAVLPAIFRSYRNLLA